MKTKSIILGLVVLFLSGAPIYAATFGDSTLLQGVLDDITINPLGDSSIDVTTDELNDSVDSYWSIGGSGGSISTVVIELASYANDNVFGIYDMSDPSNMVELFSGAATQGSQVIVSIRTSGSVWLGLTSDTDTGVDFAGNAFGFYLRTPGSQSGYWYSDSALNGDDDHMYAYEGVGDEIQISDLDADPDNDPAAGPWQANEYILAWEDLPLATGDRDFTDFVVLVESISPVPVPGAVLLGLLGLGFAGRKLRKRA